MADAIRDFSLLMPKAPDFKPRQLWGWVCFCVFNDKGEVIDIVTLEPKKRLGWSALHGDLKSQHGKMELALECWHDLVRCNFRMRIVNGALLQ